MTMSLFLSSLLFMPCLSQHAWYSFQTTQKDFDNFTSYLSWTQAEKGDVYLATQFWTGCSGGYFGGQLHSDGTHSILFSIWDFNATVKNSRGASPWCARFGGEGEGSHCGLDYVFEFGVEYRFTMTKESNASGVIWSASVTKEGAAPVSTFLGSIFIDVTSLPRTVEECAVLGPTSVSFQEYYLGGDFYSAANWRGPFLNHNPMGQVEGIVAYDANADCSANTTYPSNVSSSVPLGPSGRPNAFFQQGGSTPHGCEKSMWQHAGCTALGSEERPFHRRPTAIGATGAASHSLIV